MVWPEERFFQFQTFAVRRIQAIKKNCTLKSEVTSIAKHYHFIQVHVQYEMCIYIGLNSSMRNSPQHTTLKYLCTRYAAGEWKTPLSKSVKCFVISYTHAHTLTVAHMHTCTVCKFTDCTHKAHLVFERQ